MRKVRMTRNITHRRKKEIEEPSEETSDQPVMTRKELKDYIKNLKQEEKNESKKLKTNL